MPGPPTWAVEMSCCRGSMDCIKGADWEANWKKRGDGLDYEICYGGGKWGYLTWWRGVSVVVGDLDIRISLRCG